MASAPETELWIICPVCWQPNPKGTKFCTHCWGAALHSRCLVLSSEELERWLSRLKRRKIIKAITISLAALIILASAVYPSLYYLTDIVSAPPQGVNSNSLPGEWAMFHHDLGHSGATDSSSILPQGMLKWVFSTGGPIYSSPAVADGTLYIGSADHKLYALDATTGAKRWEYETGSWVGSSPAIVNGIVYFGSNDGRLYALDTHSGEKLWDFETRYPIASSPAVADGIVYFGADDYYIYALDAVKGTKLWDFKTMGYVASSPAVANGIVYVGSGSQFFYALNAQDERLRLYFKSPYPGFSSPVVSGKTVYISTDSGYLYAIDGNARTWPRENEIKPYWIQMYAFGLPVPTPPPQSGLLWQLRVGTTATSPPTLTDDTLYIGSGNELLAIDLQSQQIRWKFEAEGTIRSSPAVVGNTIYVGSEDGWLYAVDATTGEKLWNIFIGGKITSSPSVADGTIYIGSDDGNLYAIE